MNAKTSFDTHYAFLLKRVLAEQQHMNMRTKTWVRAIDGAFFRYEGIPLLNLRDINIRWTCAEVVWFMGGLSNVQFMREFGFRNWDPFADGKGVVHSATGYRWRYAHGVDQLRLVIDKLKMDPSDRQAVLVSWLPDPDLRKPGPNAPCLLAWHFHAIAGKLHMTVLQRSADLYFGLPHDIFGSRIVQEMIAAAVDLVPGNVSYAVSNAHLYEDQWDTAKEMVAREDTCDTQMVYPVDMNITPAIAEAAMEGDKDVVLTLVERVKKFYVPFPPLSGPRLIR